MQKSAFYAIVGISLLVTAVSLGFSTSRYLSTRFYAPPAPPPRSEDAAPKEKSPGPPPEQWTNIFAPSSGMNIPSQYADTVAGPVTTSTSAYVLLGTISSDSSSARRAILWTEGMKEPVVARENAEIEPGVRVGEIEREHVWILRGQNKEKLDLLPVGSQAKNATPTASAPVTRRTARNVAPSVSGKNASIHVNKIGENAYSLDEATVTELTGNINQFMTQVRIVPYFVANESAGYRLAAMRPGSAFAQLGFRGGDVIQRINDVELTSPEKMYTIFQNLKDEKRVTIDILRRGKKDTLTYEIR